MKNVTKNAMFFKLFWNKVFVHWKLKLLSFLVDPILSSFQSITLEIVAIENCTIAGTDKNVYEPRNSLLSFEFLFEK